MFKGKRPFLYNREDVEHKEQEKINEQGNKHQVKFQRKQRSLLIPKKKKYLNSIPLSQSSIDDFTPKNKKEKIL